MTVLVLRIAISLSLDGLGLIAFVWALKSQQYVDPDGHAARILIAEDRRHPKASKAR